MFTIIFRQQLKLNLQSWRFNLLSLFGIFLSYLYVSFIGFGLPFIASDAKCSRSQLQHALDQLAFYTNSSIADLPEAIDMDLCNSDFAVGSCKLGISLSVLGFTVTFGSLYATAYRINKVCPS